MGLQRAWPQTSLEEVRRAQELADAGDPRSTWQVDVGLAEYQLGQHHPGDAEIFGRFLEEKLGWEGFLWDEAFAHPEGLHGGEVVYIRCAPGGTNPLYAADPENPRCAPTLDPLHYETVRIHVAQPDRQGPSGIWVVTGWKIVEPVEQVAPPSDAEVQATLGAFLQARVDGEGAEGLADVSESDDAAGERIDRGIPLLYTTSAGAPYRRSEVELVDGPVWPGGWEQFKVRLFAENDQTVVEQVFSLERDEMGRLRPVYDVHPRVPGGRIPGTTENGKAVPEAYSFRGGEVTYRSAYPAGSVNQDRATVVGGCRKNEGGCVGTTQILTILADPRPVGPGCKATPAPADAEALARSLRSDPDLEADAPVTVAIGGIPALRMDVVEAAGATICPWHSGRATATPFLLEHAPFVVRGADRARLYLVDLPGGSARVLAIAIMSDKDGIRRAQRLATPIVDSIEFHVGPQGGNNSAT